MQGGPGTKLRASLTWRWCERSPRVLRLASVRVCKRTFAALYVYVQGRWRCNEQHAFKDVDIARGAYAAIASMGTRAAKAAQGLQPTKVRRWCR